DGPAALEVSVRCSADLRATKPLPERKAVILFIDVFVDDAAREGWPRSVLLHVVDKWADAGGWHVVYYDVRLRCKAFEEVCELIRRRDLGAVIGSSGRPEEQMAPGVLESSKCLWRPVE